jgi:hypothetical protein
MDDIKYKDENGRSLRGKDKTKFRKRLLSIRALKDMDQWLSQH